jgi:transposase InsO family protein
LKKVRSDNGSEFKNTNVEEFCDEKGIKHEFSTTNTPEQNGVVERMRTMCGSRTGGWSLPCVMSD